jgi:hypothetical protein
VPSSQAAGPPLAGRLWFLIQRTRSRNTHLNCRFLQPRTQYLPWSSDKGPSYLHTDKSYGESPRCVLILKQ